MGVGSMSRETQDQRAARVEANIRQDDAQTCRSCGEIEPTTEIRYSLGVYAGRLCDACWKKSGYRDEDASGFDPMDAGEAYDSDDY